MRGARQGLELGKWSYDPAKGQSKLYFLNKSKEAYQMSFDDQLKAIGNSRIKLSE